MAATVMIDRLIHHSEILSLKGDSYRLRGRDLDPRRSAHPPAGTGGADRVYFLAFSPKGPVQLPYRNVDQPTKPTPSNQAARRHFAPLAYGSLREKPPHLQTPRGLVFGQRREPRWDTFRPAQEGHFSTGLNAGDLSPPRRSSDEMTAWLADLLTIGTKLGPGERAGSHSMSSYEREPGGSPLRDDPIVRPRSSEPLVVKAESGSRTAGWRIAPMPAGRVATHPTGPGYRVSPTGSKRSSPGRRA